MANCRTIDDQAPLYHSKDATHPVTHLAVGTTVTTIGMSVNGPIGHGKIIQCTANGFSGWIYVSLIECD